MFLLIFEGLGTSELILILVVALVIFGPRKLPQLSRSLGKSLNNFKRASEDFKQTWEKEVARESAIKEALIGDVLDDDRSILGESRNRSQAVFEASESDSFESPANHPLSTAMDESSLARNAPSAANTTATPADAPEATQTRKRDWL